MLYGIKYLFDLFSDNERGIRQRLFILGKGPMAEIVGDQGGAAHENESKCDGAYENQPCGIEKMQRR